MPRFHPILFTSLLILLAGCSVMPNERFPHADNVDRQCYMGTWYVIAHIPPRPVDNAYHSIERYEQVEPGIIHTVYTYRDDGFDQELETMKPTGFVVDGTGDAIWGMQFLWPLTMQFVITYVDDNYDTTIVAREKRDHVWIMARTSQIGESGTGRSRSRAGIRHHPIVQNTATALARRNDG